MPHAQPSTKRSPQAESRQERILTLPDGQKVYESLYLQGLETERQIKEGMARFHAERAERLRQEAAASPPNPAS